MELHRRLDNMPHHCCCLPHLGSRSTSLFPSLSPSYSFCLCTWLALQQHQTREEEENESLQMKIKFTNSIHEILLRRRPRQAPLHTGPLAHIHTCVELKLAREKERAREAEDADSASSPPVFISLSCSAPSSQLTSFCVRCAFVCVWRSLCFGTCVGVAIANTLYLTGCIGVRILLCIWFRYRMKY